MDWQAKGGTDILQRIVMMLLSLADLADHTAGRSAAKRREVMWALWQANAVVTEFVATAAGPADPPPDVDRIQGDGPADAMALAVSLRWLALVVHGMAAEERRLARSRPGAASPERRRPNLAALQHLLRAALPSIDAHDTS